MSPIDALRSFNLRSIILGKEEVIVTSAFSLQLLQSIFLFTYYTLIITIGRTMKYLLGLKRFINKGIFVIDVVSYYLQLKDHSFSLVLNNTGKLKYQENACKYLVLMKSPSPLHVLLPCHRNFREVLSTKMMKASSV